MRKILVTGASGFVGGHVTAALSAEGYAIRCLVRQNSRLDFLKAHETEFYFGDVGDPASLEEALRGVRAVVHCAGITKAAQAKEYYRVNEGGAQNLFSACLKVNPSIERIILMGSLAALGPAWNGTPVSEESAPHPVGDYGKSKLAAQRIAESYRNSLPVTILIPPAVYGPRDKDFLLYFKMVKAGIMPFLGYKTRRLSLVYAADVAKSVTLCLKREKSAGRTYLLSDGEIHSWQSLAMTISHAMGRKPLSIHIPEFAARGIAFASESVARITGQATILNREKMREMLQEAWICNSARIREELGFTSDYPLEPGLRETLAWYKMQGWL